MCKIHTHVRFIICIIKIIYPSRRIRININDIGIHKIELALQRTNNRLCNNPPIIIEKGRIFGNEHFCLRIGLYVSIQNATCRVETMFPFCSFGIVKHFISIIKLSHIQLFRSGNRIDPIDTLNRPSLIFGRITPWNRLIPVQMRFYRISIPIFFYLKCFVPAKSRIGQTFPNNRIPHPIHELFILGIGYLGLIHPESINRYPFRRLGRSPKSIFLGRTYFKRTALYQYHTVRCRLTESSAAYSHHLSTVRCRRRSARYQHAHDCQK